MIRLERPFGDAHRLHACAKRCADGLDDLGGSIEHAFQSSRETRACSIADAGRHRAEGRQRTGPAKGGDTYGPGASSARAATEHCSCDCDGVRRMSLANSALKGAAVAGLPAAEASR